MNFNKKDSLTNAVESVIQQEALKGDQHKIDKNKNKKIDADDFKILRGEKKVDEEIDVKDRTVDTLAGRMKTDKKDDVGPAGNFKATKVRFHAGPDNTDDDEITVDVDKNKETENKTKLRMGEEAEQIDEKKWIAAAIKKPGAMTAAAKREGKSTSEYIKSHEHEGGKAGQRARLAKTLKSFKEQYDEHSIYDQMIQEVLSKDASAGDWIHDFVHSDNPKFAGKSKEMRKKMALAAYYAKQRNEEVEQIEEMDKSQTPPGRDGATTDPNAGPQGTAKAVTAKSFMKKAGSVLHKALTGGSDKDQLARLRKNMYGEDVEQVEEGWDDMLKSVKDRAKPQPSGGSGVKLGSRYGGGKQKDKPEHDEDKKKVTESKRPEDDSVPFAPPYNTTSRPADVVDKSGAHHTPMSRAKHLARLAMGRVKKDLGKK